MCTCVHVHVCLSALWVHVYMSTCVELRRQHVGLSLCLRSAFQGLSWSAQTCCQVPLGRVASSTPSFLKPIIYFVCVYVSMCGLCVWICVCMHVYMYVQVHVHAKAEGGYLVSWCCLCFIRLRQGFSLNDPKVRLVTSKLQASSCLSPFPQHWGNSCLGDPYFYVGSGDLNLGPCVWVYSKYPYLGRLPRPFSAILICKILLCILLGCTGTHGNPLVLAECWNHRCGQSWLDKKNFCFPRQEVNQQQL